jgi:hypothetical protein
MTTDVNNGAGGFTAADWDRVHESVQAALRPLAEIVRRRWPMVASSGGRTSTKLLPLFSHWTFEPQEGSGLEPVVVGVDFRPAEGQITVTGDITTEETGRILFDRGCRREVPPSLADVIAAARDVAATLAAQTAVLAEALVPSNPAPAT